VVLESSLQEIKKVLTGVKIKIELVSIQDSKYWGTADSLRYIKDKVRVRIHRVIFYMCTSYITDL